jgi:DNA-directed RNA polymerase subunit K/omega
MEEEMSLQIDKILSFQGNKYEKTSAMSKYARYLSQKNDEDLEIPINRTQKEKVTISAINDMLNDKVAYRIEAPVDEKQP